MAQNNLDVGIKCIKYMLLSVTAIFAIASALIISVGTTIYAIYHDVDFFLDDNFYSPATFVIVIGVIMLFVSLFGCIGALKESTCLVNMFAVILSVVLVLEIAAAIAAYSFRGQVSSMMDDNLRKTIPYYYENEEVTAAYDFIQSRLRCCGVDSYEDWMTVSTPEGSSNVLTVNSTFTVPNSCCSQTGQMLDVQQTSSVSVCTAVYSNGCLPHIIYVVYQSAGLLGIGAITTAFVQIIGIVFSFSLARAIRKAKSERERRRWEIRESMLNNAYASLTPNDEKKAPVVYVPFHGQTNA